jgi:hemolysin activation/secretion protein
LHPLRRPTDLSLLCVLTASLLVAALGRPRLAAQAAPGPRELFIQEYRVEGVRHLAHETVEETVYPFLGPGRSADDVEQARATLEKAYREAGYQTVAVQLPPQQVRDGVVVLQVVEGAVARLRVNGARFSSPNLLKSMVPSLAEGSVVNFNDVPREIVALNQLPDRRVTPALRPGESPGTVDVDLNVVETTPLHASVELNNRRSAHTTSLRANASVSDNNFLQRGDSLGLSFQMAPQRPADAKVFSGYYLTRFPLSGVSLMLQGTKQDSNVSTLGGAAVTGRGETIGARALLRLPAARNFFQTLSLGLDYKHFDQTLRIGGSDLVAPITYWPLSANYSATFLGEKRETDASVGVTLHLRGLGSDPAAFDNRRYQADGSFFYVRGELSHERELGHGVQVFARASGQLANQALLDSEEASGGGFGTVRGYLESEVVGDNAAFATLELRSPAFGARLGEWRAYVFGDAGMLNVYHALPQQRSYFYLTSYGAGTRVRFRDHFNGSVDAAVPLVAQSDTQPHDLRFTFRLWADF